jgi:hypothetical protein
MIFLAFGTVTVFYELNSYNQKQEMERNALKMVGDTAAQLMVSSPTTICEVVDDKNTDHTLFYLQNCLSKTQGPPPQAPAWGRRRKNQAKGIWKTFIGVPADYDCSISVESIGLGSNEAIATDCDSDSSNARNVYSVTKKIVVLNIQKQYWLTKSKFIECRNKDPNCVLVDGNITIMVWKK